MFNNTTKDAIRTKSNIQPCNAFTCLFTLFFGSVSTNTHLTDHFDHYNHHPVTLTRTSLGSTDVAARSSSRNFKKIEVSWWWESVSVSKYPLTAPNNVNKPVWVGVRSKMSTNDLLMDSFSMKRSQNGSLVGSFFHRFYDASSTATPWHSKVWRCTMAHCLNRVECDS